MAVEFLRQSPMKRDALAVPRTSRGHDTYREIFCHSDKSLCGQTILDVGAGDSNYAMDVQSKGGTLIRLDAQYAEYSPYIPGIYGPAIAGLAQQLPFRDNTFDETISSYCLLWITRKLGQTLREMIRVTKYGGNIKVFPVHPRESNSISPATTTYVHDQGYVLDIYKDPTYSNIDWVRIVYGILGDIEISPYNTPDKNRSNQNNSLG